MEAPPPGVDDFSLGSVAVPQNDVKRTSITVVRDRLTVPFMRYYTGSGPIK